MDLLDDNGNVRVDFVWGNIPMQPDDVRDDNWDYEGGGVGDYGWDGYLLMNSDNLEPEYYAYPINAGGNSPVYTVGTNHNIVFNGWSNFPGYIPNYEGDEDTGLEAVVPQIMRKSLAEADDLLGNVGLNLFAVNHYISINYIESDDTTVRVWCYDTNASGGGYPEAFLVGLRTGDKVYVDSDYGSFPDLVTVTAVNEDGTDSWFEFEVEEAPNLDDTANGTVWAGPELSDKITVIRSWNQEGSIKNINTNIHVRYISN